MYSQILRLIFLGAVNHQITKIIVDSTLFRSCRETCAAIHPKLGELVSCHLCFGTWVGFWLAAVFRPRFLQAAPPAGVSPETGYWFGTAANFLADSFLISMTGRFFNEVLGLLQREVKVRDEQAELIESTREVVEETKTPAPVINGNGFTVPAITR
ncbi:MAG: hypothetical protein HY329_10570 [Chloroflexi bacterium]|nr:hypothetical protein [Chloroflexota bacterium]